MSATGGPFGSGPQGPTATDTGFMSKRAAQVEDILKENSYGLEGKYTDSDHYAQPYALGPQAITAYGLFKHRIQMENAMLKVNWAAVRRSKFQSSNLNPESSRTYETRGLVLGCIEASKQVNTRWKALAGIYTMHSLHRS